MVYFYDDIHMVINSMEDTMTTWQGYTFTVIIDCARDTRPHSTKTITSLHHQSTHVSHQAKIIITTIVQPTINGPTTTTLSTIYRPIATTTTIFLEPSTDSLHPQPPLHLQTNHNTRGSLPPSINGPTTTTTPSTKQPQQYTSNYSADPPQPQPALHQQTNHSHNLNSIYKTTTTTYLEPSTDSPQP